MALSDKGPVRITRDQWGIGHASAPDAMGAFAAQGWLHAADRLWQMDWDRRRAFGRWAEVAGPSGVAEDRLFRRIGMADRARAAWDALSPDTKAMTEAHARGVNAWVDAHGDDLPEEFAAHEAGFEPWEPWHGVAVYQIRHFFMGTFHRKLWRAALCARAEPDLVQAMVGDVGSDTPIVPLDGGSLDLFADAERAIATAAADVAALPDVDGASNSWAIHGTRTAGGTPLLAGDPHRGIEFPNVYHQCHIACDEFDAIGLGFPGVPGFPHFGHNAEVAWCITHGMADDTDVFVEQGVLSIERTETIHVRGAEPVSVECASTDRGPVVLGDPGAGAPCLSMQWTAWHGSDTTFESLWPMLTADGVDPFEDALRPWVIPVNSLLCADRAGSISFHVRGRVVERPPANRWSVVPGEEKHDWSGLEPVDFDDLPAWRNPERGFLVTANNKISDGPPYISLDFANPARHDRIVQLLTHLDPASADVAAMTAIHRDTHSLVADEVVPMLLAAQPSTDAGQLAQSTLRSRSDEPWSGEVAADSAAALVYGRARLEWALEVGRRLDLLDIAVLERGAPTPLFASRALFGAAQRLLARDGWQHLPGVGSEDLPALLGAALDAAGAHLVEAFGPDPARWQWADAHQMVSPHPLATARPELAHLHPPVDGVPGDNDTVRCAAVYPITGDRAAASSVARYAFDLGDWDRSGWAVVHGVSGRRGSGHDLDQRPAWLAGELVPMAYSADAVAAVAEDSFEL